jgi:hypothetical protein
MSIAIFFARATIGKWERCQDEPDKIKLPHGLGEVLTIAEWLNCSDIDRARLARAFACDWLRKGEMDSDDVLRELRF